MQGSRPPRGRLALAIAAGAVPIAALALGVMLLASRDRPTSAARTAAPAASGSRASSPGVGSPSPEPMAILDSDVPEELAAVSWFRISHPLTQGRPSAFVVGRLDGTVLGAFTASASPGLMATGLPVVDGPRAGRVAFVADAGTADQPVAVIDTTDGTVTEAGRLAVPIHDLAMSPDGMEIYAAVAAGNRISVWRLAADGSREPAEVVFAAADRPQTTLLLAAPVQLRGSIVASDDGRHLAVLECFAECALHLVEVDSGRVTTLAPVENVGPLASFGQTIVGAGTGHLDPATGAFVLDPEPPPAAPGRQLFGFPSVPEIGVELPAGWVLATEPDGPWDPETGPRPAFHIVAVDEAGEVVPLPLLGPAHFGA